ERKIHWVSWANVCKPKADGGLGIRDHKVVNLALLGKWRWRLLCGGQGIWKDILLERYGSLYPSLHLGGRPSWGTSWCKDVSLLGAQLILAQIGFMRGLGRKLVMAS
ncbi:ribonuclease H protein, partial [Trifolium medium]|nr:ribonuclease H protein [Trifolium medium]